MHTHLPEVSMLPSCYSSIHVYLEVNPTLFNQADSWAHGITALTWEIMNGLTIHIRGVKKGRYINSLLANLSGYLSIFHY